MCIYNNYNIILKMNHGKILTKEASFIKGVQRSTGNISSALLMLQMNSAPHNIMRIPRTICKFQII